ncbi:hypothetical protein F4778DRAFT_745354 [Xylariomycetidae sp. FL2044]|nr:hypothetical protein F4778DRAFT_745354 [Xylariomycetidae sp. FL2044]
MTDYVEARSLASLNYLASNPPQYPKKPTEDKQDPLTLYISRVPGARDIILSTLRPQVKNVTAEDVASSLYYVHLDSPDDVPLLAPERISGSPRSSEESLKIQRKPLPGGTATPPSSLALEDGSMSKPLGKENQPLSRRAAHPQEAISLPTDLIPQPRPITGPIHRKPLGPRPPATDASHPGLPPPPDYDQSQGRFSGEYPPPALPPRPTARPSSRERTDPFVASPSTRTEQSRHSSPSKLRPFTPFSLTLIRRDPSSGQQWNVGKVASFQLEYPELINQEKYHQPSPSISIHIETSGYAKFRGLPMRPPADIRSSLDIRPSSASSNRLHPNDANHPVRNSGTFERQVMMSYTPSFTASLKKRFRSLSLHDDDDRAQPPYDTRPRHGRQESTASIGSFGGDFEGGEPPAITRPGPGLKPRGYTFYSPWDGRCEFLTGNAGRSLRLRHILPNNGGNVFNPLVDGNDEDNGDGQAKRVQPISELRFNLPSSELFADKRSTEGGARARDQIQSQFHRMVQKAQGHDADFDDSDDADYPLDLSLGREKAGGGNRGKRAKMGKLIILDEGLKMLDLVVAANVGVWWAAWERTYVE